MAFEVPPLRVSRPVSACSRCRSAKIKCDGKLPACTACERSGRRDECSSANDQFAKGKERSYVASLQSRIEKLERQVAQAKRRKSSVTMPDSTTPEAHSQDQLSQGPALAKTQSKEASDVDDLVADFGFLSVNATARDFHGFTEEMSFAKLVLSTSVADKIPQVSGNNLPSRDIAVRLVQSYLDVSHTLYPIVSETALFGSIEAVYSRDGSLSTPLDFWNVRLVLAIALSSQSRNKGDLPYRDAVRHVSGALSHVEAVLQPGSIVGIQAILLLVVYAMLDPTHFRSWFLTGVASRLLVDLGLHQDAPPRTQTKDCYLSIRRRMYYCVYSLDRMISMACIRAFSFTDDSLRVSIPKKAMDTPSPSAATEENLFLQTLDPALHLLEFRQIQSAWYQALLQSNHQALTEPWECRWLPLKEMHDFSSSLPNSVDDRLKRFFRTELLFSSILLISPPGSRIGICEYGKALIFEYATEYAGTILKMCEDVQDFALLTVHDVQRASFVGQRLLDILQQNLTYVFGAVRPLAPTTRSDSILLPTLSMKPVEANLEAAILAVQQMSKILDNLRIRFGDPASYYTFTTNSDRPLQQLFAARNRRISLPRNGSQNSPPIDRHLARFDGGSISGDPYGFPVHATQLLS